MEYQSNPEVVKLIITDSLRNQLDLFLGRAGFHTQAPVLFFFR